MTDTHTTSQIPDEAVQAAFEAMHPMKSPSECCLYDIKKAIIAALPHLSAPCAVEVKKLEWRKPTDHPQDMEGECSSVANGIGGRYSISNPERNKDGVYGWLLYLADDEFRWEWFPSIGEAKAAAQADFERRILSCVVTKPVDVAAVRRQAFEEGFENGVEQSLNALDAYDDITRNEAEQSIRKLKPDYRALSAAPTTEAGK
ncbi:hypothetical protein [Pseudochrobactrum saccharolyticum]|uniref:hypothetical protein n=1 Tax=Pseudochrobactrum saccharolyticum TaxID=354352 RepID=UPI00275AF632|nr:hypothetical protein [Pseudochrobactrum saccharolyticum]MDP8249952.1 hypothetical protein [Pseudochrobactrum saccharolyticum]